MQVAIMVSV